MSSAQSRSVYK